jgi:transcriptional regulator with XRE-family HTH domain
MINEALRLIRVFHDLKQNELAERLGVSKSFLSEVESGRKAPTLDLISKYSKEFKIPASSILFFSEQMPSPDDEKPVHTKGREMIAKKVLSFLALVERKTDHAE